MIREMTERDWNRVAEIYNQGIEGGISTFTTECPSYAEWDSAHLKECRFVYEDAGNVAGWIALSPTSARECYKGVVEVSIYVDRLYAHKGIGSALIEYLKNKAPEFGIWSLFSVICEINPASVQLHKKCGFREIGWKERVARDKNGNWQNTVLMEYRL